MMDWKKWVCFTVMIGGMLVMGTQQPLWASEADLIQILKEKNVISQEEADRMMEKVKSKSQQEKSEIKDQLKTEIKEDIKKDAGKGEFLPSALKGFKFGTTIFTNWESKQNLKGTNANTNSFNLDRAYLSLSKDVNDWLGMNITTDLFRATDTNDASNGYELRIKYAYADLKFFGTSTKVGVVPTPSDAYDNSIWPYRVQGKNYLDAMGIQSSADAGIVNQGVFAGYMDDEYLEYASKPFSGKWGGYMIGLYNGAGYDRSESNNNKAVSGLIYLRPLPTTPVLKGLQLAYVGNYGVSNNKYAAGSGPTNDYPDWRVNISQVSLIHKYFGLMGQYYWGKGLKTSTEENDRNGYLAAGFVRIPGLEKLRAFGKYYTYNPDTNSPNKDYKVHVAGLSYDWSKEFMPFVSWEREDNEVKSTRTDYNKYQIGFQLKF
jgi:hypothetical protein